MLKKLFFPYEPISKLLKIVKASSLRSAKGSVFSCYPAGSSFKLPFAHRFYAIAKCSVSYDILFCYVAAYLNAEWKTYIVEGSGYDAATYGYCEMLIEFVTNRTDDSWNRICYVSRSLGVETSVFLGIRIRT